MTKLHFVLHVLTPYLDKDVRIWGPYVEGMMTGRIVGNKKLYESTARFLRLSREDLRGFRYHFGGGD